MQPSASTILPAVFLATVIFGNTAALAKNDTMLGRWIAVDGSESLLLEPNSIGFNEHTVCELPNEMPEGNLLSMQIECANFYLYEGEFVRAFEKTILFEARYISPDELIVTIGPANDPVLYKRSYE